MSAENSAQKLTRLINKTSGATPQSVDTIVANKIAAVNQRAVDKKALFSNTVEDKLLGLRKSIAYTEALKSPYSVPNSLDGFNLLFPNATEEDKSDFGAIEDEKVRVRAVEQHNADLNSKGNLLGDSFFTPLKAGTVQLGGGLINLTDKYLKTPSQPGKFDVGDALKTFDNIYSDNAGQERRKGRVGISEFSENFTEDGKPIDIVLQESAARIREEGLSDRAKADTLDREIERAEFDKTNIIPTMDDYRKRVEKDGAATVYPQFVAEHATHIGKEFWNSFTTLAKRPSLGVASAVESIPIMIASALMTRLGIPGTVAIGLLEGSSNAGSIETEILKASEADLNEGSAQYRALREQNFSHRDARREIANRAGLVTFGISSVAAMGSAKLFGTGKLTESLFNPTSKIGKNIITRTAEKVLRASLSEGGEELFQGATGTMAENFARQLFTDKDQTLTENVGSAMGEGLIAGSMAGGGLTLAGSTLAAVPATLKGAARVTGKVVKPAAKNARAILKTNAWKLDEITRTKDTDGYERVTNVNDPNYDPKDAIYVMRGRDPEEYENSPTEKADHINEFAKHVANRKTQLEDELIDPKTTKKRSIEIVAEVDETDAQIKMVESGQFYTGDMLKEVMSNLDRLSTDKIDRVLGSARQRENINIQDLEIIANNPNATDQQQIEVKNRIESQKTEEKLLASKDTGQVGMEELNGGRDATGKSWKGFKQHLSAVSQAVRGTDFKIAQDALKNMTDFLVSRVTRADKLKAAIIAIEKAEKTMTGSQIKEDSVITAMLQELGLNYTYFKNQENNPTGSKGLGAILKSLNITVEVGEAHTKEARNLYDNTFPEFPVKTNTKAPKAPISTTPTVDRDVVPDTTEEVVVEDSSDPKDIIKVKDNIKKLTALTKSDAPLVVERAQLMLVDEEALLTSLLAREKTAEPTEVSSKPKKAKKASTKKKAAPKKAAAVDSPVKPGAATSTASVPQNRIKAAIKRLQESEEKLAEVKNNILSTDDKRNIDDIPELGESLDTPKSKPLPKNYVAVANRKNISLADMRDLNNELMALIENRQEALVDEQRASEIGMDEESDAHGAVADILAEQIAANETLRKKYVTVNGLKVTASSDMVDYAKFLGDMMKKFGLEGNLHVTTIEEYGKRSTGVSPKDLASQGLATTVEKNNYVISLNLKAMGNKRIFGVEVASHELGHILEWHLFNNLSAREKAKIFEAYDKWLADTNSVSPKSKGAAAHFTLATRPFFSGKKAAKDAKDDPINGEDYYHYITSFSEWHADQVAKWATSTAEPQNIIERYFSDVAALFRSVYKELRAFVNGKEFNFPGADKYKADPTIQKYLDNAFAGNMSVAIINQPVYAENKERTFINDEGNYDRASRTNPPINEVSPTEANLSPLEQEKAKKGYKPSKLRTKLKRNLNALRKIIDSKFDNINSLPGIRLPGSLAKLDVDGITEQAVEAIFNDVAARLAALQEATQQVANQALTGTFDGVLAEMYKVSTVLSSNYLRTYPNLFENLRDKESAISKKIYSQLNEAESKLLEEVLKFEDAFKQFLLFGEKGKSKNSPFISPVIDLKQAGVEAKFFKKDIFKYFLKDTDGLNTPQEDLFDSNTISQLALAGFTWFASRGLRTMNMPEEVMNLYMGKQKDTPVTDEMRDLFEKLGTLKDQTNYNIGRDFLRSMGLVPKATTTEADQTRMEAAVGDVILVTMGQMQIIETKTLSITDLESIKISDAKVDLKKSLDVTQYVTDQELDENGYVKNNNFGKMVFVRVKTRIVYDIVLQNDVEEPVGNLAELVNTFDEGSQLLNVTFGADINNAGAMFEEPTKVNPKVRNSEARVPDRKQEIMDKIQKRPKGLRQDNLGVFNAFGRSEKGISLGLAKIGGYISDIKNTVTLEEQKSVESKNRDILRDQNILERLLAVVKSGRKIDPKLYHKLVMFSNGRINNDTTSVNEQSSKLHRRMLGTLNHRDIIQTDGSDVNVIERFLYAVAENLGVSGNSNEDVLSNMADLAAKIENSTADPVFVEAIAAIQAIQSAQGSVFTKAQEAAVVAASKAGGAGFASLDALIGLAAYLTARKTNSSFRTGMYRGADATNSGVALSIISLMEGGAEGGNLELMLEKTGIYFDDTTDSLKWKAKTGNNDIYETAVLEAGRVADSTEQDIAIIHAVYPESVANEIKTASRVLSSQELFDKDMSLTNKAIVTYMGRKRIQDSNPSLGHTEAEGRALIADMVQITSGVTTIMGEFTSNTDGLEFVESTAREMFKFPIIASTYGAFLNSSARNFADKAIASFFSELTTLMNAPDSANKSHRIAALEEALNRAIYPNGGKRLSLNITNFQLSKKETALLRDSILLIKGEALKTALNGGLGGIFKARKAMSARAQEAVILFETVYNTEVEIAMAKQNGKALTIQEKKSILEKLNYMMPVVETSLGKPKGSNTGTVDLNEGMPLFKLSDRELNKTDEYSTRLRIAGKTKQGLVDGNKSVGGRGRSIKLEPLGVATGAMLNIQMDADVMALVTEQFDALNLYDEIGLKLREEEVGTAEINKAFIETLSSYDPLTVMSEALQRTIIGYTKYIADGKAKIIKDGGTESNANNWAQEINTALIKALKAQKYIGKYDPQTLTGVMQAAKDFGLEAVEKAKARKVLLNKITTVIHYNSNSTGYKHSDPQYTEEAIPELVEKLIEEEIKKATDISNKLGSSPASNNNQFVEFENDSTYRDAIGEDAPDYITSLNTTEVFENLLNIGHQKESPEHVEHLRYVLTNIIAPTMVKAKMKLQTKGTSTRGDAIPDAQTVFISNSTGRPESKINMSVAGVFAHELGHLATYDQININEGAIQRELHVLFKYVQREVKRGNITFTAFLPDPSDTSNKVDNEIAKERLAHIFENMEVQETTHMDEHSQTEFTLKRNNFLHEFAMLGLFDENFRRSLIEFTPPTGKLIKGKNFAEKFMHFFQELLRRFDQRLLGTRNLNAADKLQRIIERMVDVEDKNKTKLAKSFAFFDTLDRGMRTALTKAIVQPLVALASTRALQQSKYALLSSAAKVISVAPTVRFKDFIESLRNTRRRMGASALGLVDSTLRELSGPSPDMIKYYTMVSTVNKHVDQNGQTINNIVSTEMREAFLKAKLAKEENHAISRVFMRGDMSVLYEDYTHIEIEAFLNEDQAAVDKEIVAIEAELLGITDGKDNNGRIVEYYMLMARSLAGIMMNGKAEAKVSNMNTYNIANLNLSNQRIDPAIADTAEIILNKLVALESIKRANNKDKANLKKVYEREYDRKDINGDPIENGIDFISAASLTLKEEAVGQDGVLRGQRALAVQGYVKDIYDKDTNYKVGTLAEAAKYEKLQYERLTKPIPTDPLADETSNEAIEPLYIYINKDRRATSREAGAVTMRQEASQGTDVIQVSSQQGSNEPGLTGGIQGDAILKKNMDLVDEFFNGNDTLSLDGETNVLVPITDGTGQISGWRYIMDEKTKRIVLNRDDEFGAMMASMASASKVNPIGTRMNSRIVEHLLETFQTATLKQSEHFVFIGEKATDPKLKEIWQRIPPTMRKELGEAFGEKGFYINEQLVEQLFGRKKKRFSDWLDKHAGDFETMEKENRNAFAELLLDHIGARKIRKTGDMWAELVKLAKYSIVVKLGEVLLENVLSNTLVLYTAGLSVPEIVRYNISAIGHSREYIKNTKIVLVSEREQNVKERRIKAGNITAAIKIKLEKEIKALQIKINQSNELMAISPVRTLNEAGLYQTIVEEIDIEQNTGKYAGVVADKLKPVTKQLGKLKGPVSEFFVDKSSATGNFLKIATQQSDFIARYAMHQHNMKKQKMSETESLAFVKKLFVTYDTMTHGNIQYGNDIGLLMFSKYVLRIQGQIINLAINHPARFASLLLVGGLFNVHIPFISNTFVLTGSLLHNVNIDPTDLVIAPLANVYTNTAIDLVTEDSPF